MTPPLAEQIPAAAAALPALFPAWDAPEAVVQLGTGFLVENLLDAVEGKAVSADLPGMPAAPSPAGHPMTVLLGRCGSRQVLVFHGRRHLYEGFGIGPCVLPVAAAVRAGVPRVILLSSVGGVREDLKPGTVMVVTDYINNLGASPLAGNQSLAGDRPFPEMRTAFSLELGAQFTNAAAECGICARLGVYQANLGPQFETPAEVIAARRNGADVVGMSLVPETIIARAMGAEVLGIALVANKAAAHTARPPDHEDSLEAGRYRSPAIMRALNLCLRGNGDQPDEESPRPPRRFGCPY